MTTRAKVLDAVLVDMPILAGMLVLAGFRLALELGFGPTGGLYLGPLPIEYPLLAWFLGALAIRLETWRAHDQQRERIRTLFWWWSVAGLAVVGAMVQAFAQSGVLARASWVYWFAGAAVLSPFLRLAATVKHRGLGFRTSLVGDAVRLSRSLSIWLAVFGSIWLVRAAPRGQQVPSSGAPFERWYLRQPRVDIPGNWQVAPVTLVEATDYLCPVCRQAADDYRPVIEAARLTYGAAFAHVRVDFPLEEECNPTPGARPGIVGLHPAACEAAVAVRSARAAGPAIERSVVSWIWESQRSLTPTSLEHELSQRFGVVWNGQFRVIVADVAREAQLLRSLGVTGTPTYFLNGRRLPYLAPDALNIAIEAEALAHQLKGERHEP